MNTSDIIAIFNSLKDIFSKKNNLALALEKNLRNKKSVLWPMFFTYLLVIFALILNVIFLFKKEILVEIFIKEEIANLVIGIITVLDSFSMLFLFGRLIDVKKHFDRTGFLKDMNKEIVEKEKSSEGKISFDKTKDLVVDFYWQGVKNYIIQSILPILMVVIISAFFLIKGYTIERLATWSFLGVLCAFVIALNWEETDKIEFVVSNIYNEMPREEIIGMEVVCIENNSYYISDTSNKIIYFDNNKYIELKLKISICGKKILNIALCYVNEYKEALKGLLQTKIFDKNEKKEIEEFIQTLDNMYKEVRLSLQQ